MNRPISIFYHCRLSGGRNVDSGATIDPSWGRTLFQMQMNAVVESDLYENANALFIGLNGHDIDRQFVVENMPYGSDLIFHGPGSESLLPTMNYLQKWAKEHPDFYVLFFHSKGATHPNESFSNKWRECLMRHCVHNWRKCVADLDAGNDAVGCHWMPNSPTDPNADRWGRNSYFAGVFWWATAKYLNTLPALPEETTDRHSWFLPELWLGCGKPKIVDYHPGFPNHPCSTTAP